ncbi:MAG TPA: O-antigen ligase family protein [Candidatus Saccharimonadia bacterium]|nr:O-antigen ligase family protein [Candidatus Saccharimonadia bacterium]
MIQTQSLRRGIEAGLVTVAAVMPFHAFLSVWLGHITHHQSLIQSWKEVVLLVLAAAAVVLLTRDAASRDRLRTWPVVLIALFALVSVIVTIFTHPSVTAVAYGAKTDFEFLVAFTLSVVVASPKLVKNVTWAVLGSACLVIVFGILEFTVLPHNFLTHFGYGPATIKPYETLGKAVGNLRFPSTLGGPNQLGTYLILPFALAAMTAFRRKHWWWIALVVADPLLLIHTYSRGAWLGEAAAAIVIVIILTPSRLRLKATGVLIALTAIAAIAIEWLLKKGSNLQYYIFHNAKLSENTHSSDTLHLLSLQTGLTDSLKVPFGHGLGTAGPAVFHTGSGLIIENNYLQLSYETGILGAAVFVAIVLATAFELARRAAKIDLAAASLAALVGISITALFLPAWTDSSTALILWIAAGSAIGLDPDTRHV